MVMENVKEKIEEYYKLPDTRGHFGIYGGSFVPETLVKAANELDEAFESVKNDKDFNKEFEYLLKNFAGRPTPIFFTRNLSDKYGARFFLKERTFFTPVRTKSTTQLARHFSQRNLGRKESLPRPARDSMGLPPRPSARFSDCNVLFIWVKRTCIGRNRTFSR